ncbi:MAG: TM0106 family RecB-like putative nuclease [Candidatus Binatia bacterium]
MAERRRKITLEGLIHRAKRGRKFNRHLLFRPSLVYKVLKDPFWVWCAYNAPKKEAVDETNRYDKMRFQRGLEFEQEWVQKHYPDAVKIKPEFGFAALKHTLQAMMKGTPALYQPQLWDLGRETYGKGDLLIRDDSRGSDLGPFHYRVLEIKRSSSLQENHIMQAAFYNRTVGMLQGYVPETLTVVLNMSDQVVPYIRREKGLEKIIDTWKALRNGDFIPEPGRPPDTTGSPWRVYGNRRIQAEKDLVLLAGIQKREREKLRRAGIPRIDQLWNLRLEEIYEILGERTGATAYFVAQAYKIRGPILKPGRRLNIPRGKRLLYFDFETSDQLHPTEAPHVYLVGCWDAMRDQFVKFLARGAEDEGRIFSEFLDYVGDVKDTRLYHWTNFEIRQMRKVMGRWPALRGPLGQLISRCADLKQAIQSAVYLPVPTFSIKSVAPILGFRWRQEGFGAFESMVCYWDYLDGKDEGSIQRVVCYNEDDCLAMWTVDQEIMSRLG